MGARVTQTALDSRDPALTLLVASGKSPLFAQFFALWEKHTYLAGCWRSCQQGLQ